MPSVAVVIPMFRTGQTTLDVVQAVLRCRRPDDVTLKIIVVDDYSCDGSAECIEQAQLSHVCVVRQPINMGRSAARNRGAFIATADYLLFVDSDCVPADDRFILRHIATIQAGATVSMGEVSGNNDGFWHAYQASALARRKRASVSYGIAMQGSSQNFAVRRDAFLEASGFDEGYSNYGFEDRDLFLRIEAHGHCFAWTPDAVVRHCDTLDLLRVCSKMAEAGGPPAVRFFQRHPGPYDQLGYGKLDGRYRRWLRALEPLTTCIARWFAPWLSRHLESAWIPIRLRTVAVRLTVAASYLHGTVAPDDQNFFKT